MRRLKRSAERAAAASHGLSSTVRFNASRRIPSWNCIARENSTGSLEDFLADVAASHHQGGSGTRNWRTHRTPHDGSDSESENVDLNSWTRSGGPLMRTTSADKFIDFVQNLEIGSRLNKGLTIDLNNIVPQMAGSRDPFSPSPRVTTPDRNSDTEFDQRDFSIRVPAGSSSITVGEGDLLQPERTNNGIVFNVVRKGDLTPSNRSLDSENNSSVQDAIAECVQLESPEKEMDISSVSEDGEHDVGEGQSRANEVDSVHSCENRSTMDDGNDKQVVDKQVIDN
ncbi:hypothetical protein RND71_004267 [Anisodus tanguticus]|uniref:Uncharacterized protein n=1 Tax=Anisodus tanguticus TaxID=243964 RepID=A0AAE1SYB4_9SOLA|nr:hypothetical protein RND71_004267 [Anisodus tanguticus]